MSVRFPLTLLTSALLLSLSGGASAQAAKAHAAGPKIENRAAQGDVTQFGGARRLTEEQTAALRASLSDKQVKNVILLIGDGMGDSEIKIGRAHV